MWTKRISRCVAFVAFGVIPLTARADDTASGPKQAAEPVCDENPRVVEFSVGSVKLSTDAKTKLDDVASWAKDTPSRSLRLHGQTDSSGNAKANAKLSERRADAVKAYLADRGVDPARMTSSGHGENESIMANADRRAVAVTSCTAPAPMVEAAPPAPEPAPVVEAAPPAPPTTIIVQPAPAVAAPVADAPVVATAPMPVGRERPASYVGIGAMVGGGVMGFVDNQTRAFAGTGGSWEARVTVGTRTAFALEAAYVGSAQGLSALGLSNSAKLVGNGAEAALRLNLTRSAIQPYIFGGAGWTHYKVDTSGSNTSSLLDSDDVLTVPFGAGISFRLPQGLLLDLRATGRAAYYDDLMAGAYANTGKDARLHSWNAGGRLGWEF